MAGLLVKELMIRGDVERCLVVPPSVLVEQWQDSSSAVANRLVYRDEANSLEVVGAGRPWSFDADGSLLRPASEAHRIRLAHLFDPYLASHTSRVEPLPHRIPTHTAGAAFEDRHTGQYEVAFGGVPDRTRTVQIEQVHRRLGGWP